MKNHPKDCTCSDCVAGRAYDKATKSSKPMEGDSKKKRKGDGYGDMKPGYVTKGGIGKGDMSPMYSCAPKTKKTVDPYGGMKGELTNNGRKGDGDGDGKNWIAGAISKPGALHKELGIPQDKKIPNKMLNKAAKAPGVEGKRARLARTLKSFNK